MLHWHFSTKMNCVQGSSDGTKGLLQLPPLPLPPCRSELFSYTSCVSYAVLTSLISLDRVALKKRVVDSPEIRSVIGHVPELETCLNSLYDCKYKEFFRVGGYGGVCWGR